MLEDRIIQVPSRFFQVHVVCEKCNEGTMQLDTEKPMLTSMPPKWHHTCNKCQNEELLPEKYPAMGSGPVQKIPVLRLKEHYTRVGAFLPAANYIVEREWDDGETFGYVLKYMEMDPHGNLSYSTFNVDSDYASYERIEYHPFRTVYPVLAGNALIGYATQLGEKTAALRYDRMLPILE